jgi:hypothetical protein
VALPLQLDGLLEHDEAVFVHILVVVVFVDLQPQRRQLGEHACRQTGGHEELEAGPGGVGQQQLAQLVADPLHGHNGQLVAQLLHRPPGRVGHGEAELRGKPGGAQHPQRVVPERHLRRSRRCDPARQQVVHAAGRVDEHPLR